jgi:hypothetical protein
MAPLQVRVRAGAGVSAVLSRQACPQAQHSEGRSGTKVSLAHPAPARAAADRGPQSSWWRPPLHRCCRRRRRGLRQRVCASAACLHIHMH